MLSRNDMVWNYWHIVIVLLFKINFIEINWIWGQNAHAFWENHAWWTDNDATDAEAFLFFKLILIGNSFQPGFKSLACCRTCWSCYQRCNRRMPYISHGQQIYLNILTRISISERLLEQQRRSLRLFASPRLYYLPQKPLIRGTEVLHIFKNSYLSDILYESILNFDGKENKSVAPIWESLCGEVQSAVSCFCCHDCHYYYCFISIFKPLFLSQNCDFSHDSPATAYRSELGCRSNWTRKFRVPFYLQIALKDLIF